MRKSPMFSPFYTLCLIITCLSPLSVTAQTVSTNDIVFETDSVRYTVGGDGISKSLVEKKTNREWISPGQYAFASVKSDGKYFSATGITREADICRIIFGASGIQADFRIVSRPQYIVIEIVRITGENIDELTLPQLKVTCNDNYGYWLGVTHNKEFALCMLGLSDCVNVRMGGQGIVLSSVYPEFGMEGQKVALVACPSSSLYDIIQKVENDFGLPSPKLNGEWAKTSRAVYTGYFFTDLTEHNADETIRYAKLGGFEYIMTYSGTWSTSLGSYPINTNNFPRGEASLKATIDKCHAAGMKVGLHFLTSFVGKNDPLVRPIPDSRFLKDDQAVLSCDIDEKTNSITATTALTGFPTEGAFYGDNKAGFDIQIDDELIQYRIIGGSGTNVLLKCVRGYAGTKAASHKAGATIYHLVERYGCYLADLRTTLKDTISERVAGVINNCGFDMVYFDGGECNGANGPYWYWVSKQQDDTCRRVKRELLVQGSGGTHWTWHWFARGCCDDFAAIAPKQYLDYHKIADSWRHYTTSFMPAELGWWGFLASEAHQPATMPDEVEYYAIRMLALDTPVSLETNLGALRRNGRTEEMLTLLGNYEKLRLGKNVPDSIREKLRTNEWHLVQSGQTNSFVPIKYDTQRTLSPGTLCITNGFGAQAMGFRLQAVPVLANVDAVTNIILFRSIPPVALTTPEAKEPMPGALAGRIEFAKPEGTQVSVFMVGPNAQVAGGQEGKPLNLIKHRALAVKLIVDEPTPPAGETCAVLNVQLEAGGKTYRDHYINIDFTGEQTVIIPEPNTERMLPEFRPAHANYAFKAAMYGFNYKNIVALNLRWMRQSKDKPVKCRLVLVEALSESDVPLSNPVIVIGKDRFPIKGVLQTGDYAELLDNKPVNIFNRDGLLLSSPNTAVAVPSLQPGKNQISIESDSPSCVKLTMVTVGEPLK